METAKHNSACHRILIVKIKPVGIEMYKHTHVERVRVLPTT